MNSDQEPNDEIMADSVDDEDTEDSVYGLGPIFLYRWIDCQDEYNKWYEAQIIALSSTNSHKIKVHYKGWKSKFDSWIDLQSEPERARLLHTFTSRPPSVGSLSDFSVGTKCDCLDSTDKWCQAEIVEKHEERELVRIHYVGWSDKYDEWINTDSYRIAPLHTKTSQSQNPSSRLIKASTTATNTNGTGAITSSSQKSTASKPRSSGRIKRKQKPKRSGSSGSIRVSNVIVLDDNDHDDDQNQSNPALRAMEVEDPEYKDTEHAMMNNVEPETKDEDHDDDDHHDDMDNVAINTNNDDVEL